MTIFSNSATVFLSRRNLLTLLSKLDRMKEGESSHCALMKSDDTHPTHPQSHPTIFVVAIEDEDYYTNRQPGAVDSRDDPGEKA